MAVESMAANTSGFLDFRGLAYAASSHADHATVQIFWAAVAALLAAMLLPRLKSYISYHRKMSLYPAPNYEGLASSLFSSKARDKFLSNAEDLIREGFSQVSHATLEDQSILSR